MKSDEVDRDNYTLGDRLTDASLRINESLDFGVVLQEVLGSARSLTCARYGVIAILDGSGQLKDVLCSGMTSEEEQQLRDLPSGMLFFEYFSEPEELLRLGDLLGHMRSQGLPDSPTRRWMWHPRVSFLSAPIIHLGERLGNIFVGAKETGGEFSREDEETLAMFASQAGTVIANARLLRDEQRARTDLETLIETSPVGVAVFDARTGAPVSLNREVLRIVDGLRDPDQPPEQLLAGDARPARGRTGVRAGRIPAGPGFESRRNVARRGDHDAGARRQKRDRAGERHAHPVGGRARSSRSS